MKWKTKAAIQTAISKLPTGISDGVYYLMQRTFGGLKNVYMQEHFAHVAEFLRYLAKQNRTIEGKTCLEIGTGRRLNVPLGLWLCGAAKIYTVDLNGYLKEHLVIESLDFLGQNTSALKTILGEWAQSKTFEQRLEQLLNCQSNLKSIFDLTQIEYRAPIDARALPLAAHGIDYHLSVSVFEHIPPNVLEGILREAKRVLTQNGLCLHIIDPSDHFAQADQSICLVNFLQYDDKQWQSLADNKFAYHNRLRVYELEELFGRAGFKFLAQRRDVDERSLEVLKKGFCLNEKYKNRGFEDLATIRFDVVGAFSN